MEAHKSHHCVLFHALHISFLFPSGWYGESLKLGVGVNVIPVEPQHYDPYILIVVVNI